jgi:hypothetical protein
MTDNKWARPGVAYQARSFARHPPAEPKWFHTRRPDRHWRPFNSDDTPCLKVLDKIPRTHVRDACRFAHHMEHFSSPWVCHAPRLNQGLNYQCLKFRGVTLVRHDHSPFAAAWLHAGQHIEQ